MNKIRGQYYIPAYPELETEEFWSYSLEFEVLSDKELYAWLRNNRVLHDTYSVYFTKEQESLRLAFLLTYS